MEKLKKIVEKLANIEEKGTVGRSKRIRILQKLNEKLLSEYYIKINDDYIIEPLLVEAYYYHEGKFEDGNTHKKEKQKSDLEDRFGKLYFQDDNQCGGIDICLSCGNYYLSFLIKNSIIYKPGKKEFCIQQKLYDELNYIRKNDGSIEDRIVLNKRPEKDKQIIFHTVRKGLEEALKSSSKKELGFFPDLNSIDSLSKKFKDADISSHVSKISFMYEQIAAVKFKDSKDGDFYGVTLEDGYKKEMIVAEYIQQYRKYSPEIDRRKMSKDLLGYELHKIWEEFD